MLKEIERCVYYSFKENILFEITADKDKALVIKRVGDKKHFSKNEIKKKLSIEYLRSLDIFFNKYDFETWGNTVPEDKDYVRVDYKGLSCFMYDDAELLADIRRYFNACINETAECKVLYFHSFDGGGPEYSFETEVKGIFTWYCERRYAKAGHEQLCGAGYDVIYSLYPLRKGKATAKITSFSPICPAENLRLFVETDEELRINYRFEDITE